MNTIKKFLHEQGFYGRVGIRKALVSETNKKKDYYGPRKKKLESWME